MASHELWIISSFATFILLFLGVGIYSGSRQQKTVEDYLLASRAANPWLLGLSTVATSNSGYVFIGLIGLTYRIGIAAAWLIIGWVVGDFLAWTLIHRRLRQVSEHIDTATVSSFLGQETIGRRWLTVTAAVTTVAFVGVYAATQLQAGSKALSVIFGWDYAVGIILGAVIVTIYCFAGGIRASIWVGSIQSILMIMSMLILVATAVITSGGFAGLWAQLYEIDPTLLDWSPPDLKFGLAPFALSWLMAGFGVVGQPHVMRRVMAIDSSQNVPMARNIYTSLYITFAIAALLVGLASRVLLPELINGADTELALPQLTQDLLPALLVGVVLAGLFAATISTADAQLLTCSAALTQDVFPKASKSFLLARLSTLLVAIIILAIALLGDDNVFVLATLAWSTLASGLGPLMVVRALRLPVSTLVGLVMMVTGVATSLTWRLGLGLSDSVCEALPGMVVGALIYLVNFSVLKGRSLLKP